MRDKHLPFGSEPTTPLRGAVRLLAAALGAGALIAGLSIVTPTTAAPAEAATATVTAATVTAATTPSAATTSTPAAAVTGYNASELMSDEVIFDTTTMTQASIQKFLQDKSPRCSGALCLKNFTVTTRVKDANELCSKYTAVTNEKASAIIYKVSQACKVNPQVLLTILQKEQSLVTSTTATSANYRAATGYSCPDNASCNPAYAGFFMQVISAARQLHLAPNYPVGTATAIAYSPNATCGSLTLTLKNKATAALYSYTPYAANPALLAGKADSCSVAGNVNLVKTFTGWFGNPVLTQSVKSYVHAAYQDVLGRAVSDTEVARQTRSIMNGTSRDTLSYSFLISNENRKAFIRKTYQDVLGRTAEESGVKNWLAKMVANPAVQDDLTPNFIATPEFYKNEGHGTDQGYVTALYSKILHRAPSSSEVSRWVAKVRASGNGRATVALGIWRSNESCKHRTSEAYATYLGSTRVARDSEQQAWATKIAKTGYYKAVAGIIASNEYLNAAVKRFPQAQ